MNYQDVLGLMKKDALLNPDADIICEAIDNGIIDTCDLFDDFVEYVSKNADVDYDTLMNYKENYQNLLSHKENLLILLEEIFPI